MVSESKTSDSAPAALGSPPAMPSMGDAWGWALVQRDWSVRQRESGRTALRLMAMVARIDAALSWLWRLVRGARRTPGAAR